MHGMNDVTLETVRELGFNNTMGMGRAPTEMVFFLGPCRASGPREDGAHATEKALLNFISYYENQIQVAKDYLANGRNNKTHEWTKSSRDSKPSIEALAIVQNILHSHGLTDPPRDERAAQSIDTLVAKRLLEAGGVSAG